MAPSKPFGVCWCDCHQRVDEEGRAILDGFTDAGHIHGWPKFDEPVALATACSDCQPDHDLFIRTGKDWLYA